MAFNHRSGKTCGTGCGEARERAAAGETETLIIRRLISQ
jgi:hypothetical protein